MIAMCQFTPLVPFCCVRCCHCFIILYKIDSVNLSSSLSLDDVFSLCCSLYVEAKRSRPPRDMKLFTHRLEVLLHNHIWKGRFCYHPFMCYLNATYQNHKTGMHDTFVGYSEERVIPLTLIHQSLDYNHYNHTNHFTQLASTVLWASPQKGGSVWRCLRQSRLG